MAAAMTLRAPANAVVFTRSARHSVVVPKASRGRFVVSASVTAAKEAEIVAYAKSLPGISAPFPDLFDPANLLSTATSVAEVKRWRESEIVHGRVSMLAALGFIVGEQLEDFPLFPHIVGPAITQFQQVEAKGAIFWEPLVLAIGLAESYRVSVGWAKPTSSQFNQLLEDYNPGELGFDPLGLAPSDPEEFKLLETKELNNGRLAMIGIAGFVAQELVGKDEIFEHLFVNLEKDIEIAAPPLV